MESSSRRFCRTSNRHSSVPSCGCAFVETRDKGSKTFAVVELLPKLVRHVFAGKPADAQAIIHAVGRIILLNEDRRVGGAEAVAETLGVGAVAERTDLHSEKTGGGIDAAKNFHAHRHDAGANRIHFSRGGKRKIDDAIVDKRAAVGDANNRGLAVVQVGDANHCFKGQRAVRRGEFVHVVDFAVRSAPPVKWHAVPRSVAFLRVTGGSRRGSGLAALQSGRGCRRSRRGLRHVAGTFRGFCSFRGCLRWLRGRRLAANRRRASTRPSQRQKKKEARGMNELKSSRAT